MLILVAPYFCDCHAVFLSLSLPGRSSGKPLPLKQTSVDCAEVCRE